MEKTYIRKPIPVKAISSCNMGKTYIRKPIPVKAVQITQAHYDMLAAGVYAADEDGNTEVVVDMPFFQKEIKKRGCKFYWDFAHKKLTLDELQYDMQVPVGCYLVCEDSHFWVSSANDFMRLYEAKEWWHIFLQLQANVFYSKVCGLRKFTVSKANYKRKFYHHTTLVTILRR